MSVRYIPPILLALSLLAAALAPAPGQASTRSAIESTEVEVFAQLNDSGHPAMAAPVRPAIQIDGNFDDWAGVPLSLSDGADTNIGTDFKDVGVTSDDRYLYLRFSLHSPSPEDPQGFYNEIFIDADGDPLTGFPFSGVGSEMVIQSGTGYQQKNGGVNEGAIDGLDWAASSDLLGVDFEMRISRAAKYQRDGTLVFQRTNILVVLETQDPAFHTVDTAPNTGGIRYTFPTSDPGGNGDPIRLTRESSGDLLIWHSGQLETRTSLSTGNWVDVANAANPLRVTPVDPARFYRNKP